MKNIVKKRENEAPYVTYAKKRVKNNLNFICMFTGAPGIGKTYNAIAYAEAIDPEFDASRQITFDFKETMKLINDPWFRNHKYKVLIWDEPQISIYNRAWQSKLNKMVNYLLSTFRHQNIILIWAAPYQDFLDSQSMKLVHCIFRCMGWSKKTHRSLVWPKIQQYNAELKKFYFHCLQALENGKLRKVMYWNIRKPSKESILIYEKLKTDFTTALNKDIVKNIDDLDRNEDDEGEITYKKPLTDLQRGILELWKRKISNQYKIAEELGKKQANISLNEGYMQRKGYNKVKYLNIV